MGCNCCLAGIDIWLPNDDEGSAETVTTLPHPMRVAVERPGRILLDHLVTRKIILILGCVIDNILIKHKKYFLCREGCFIYKGKAMDSVDLLNLRKQAGLTQEQVADALNISQSQVSRYESAPDETPFKIIKEWTALCGDTQASLGLSLAVNKRPALEEALASVFGWFNYAPTILSPDMPDLVQLAASIKTIGRKPRIAVAGKFDAGKSTMLNYLLGGKRLPTSFQPTTSLLCHIRHISDKPVWQVEPAALFKEGYDLNDPENKENFDNHKLFVGDTSILQKYAQHADRISDLEKPVVPVTGAAYAVIYLDSPILTALDFVDLPGYSNDEADNQKAEFVQNIADAFIYLSSFNGFMSGDDMVYLPTLIDKLNLLEVNEKKEPLANLFIVCTHVHAISADNKPRQNVVEEILTAAAKRIKPVVAGVLDTATRRYGLPVTHDMLRKRMFGFAVDNSVADIRSSFLSELTRYAGDMMPRATLGKLIKVMDATKNQELTAIAGLTDQLKKSLNDRATAEREVKEMREKKELTKKRFDTEYRRLSLLIDECLRKSKDSAKKHYEKIVDVSYVEKLIRESYGDSKKDAQQYVPGILLDRLKRNVNTDVAEISLSFNKDLDEVLALLSEVTKPTDSVLSFDAKSAFLSALTGLTATGALAGWAAIVAGGSNLGGYILAAKIVGWLSSLGISIGSASTVMAGISALGGPVTIAVALGATIAAGLYALFGASWETRLARKTVEDFKKNDVLSQYLSGLTTYWSDTKISLSQSMEATLDQYEKFIADRANILDLNTSEIEKRIDVANKYLGFFLMSPTLPSDV